MDTENSQLLITLLIGHEETTDSGLHPFLFKDRKENPTFHGTRQTDV